MFEIYSTPLSLASYTVQPQYLSQYPTFSMMSEADGVPSYNGGACKEFILDSTYYTIRLHSTYGASYRRVDVKYPRVIVGHIKESDAERALDCLKQFEDYIGIPRSVVKISNNQLFFVFAPHTRWIVSPPMLSFYGLIIRAAVRQHVLGESFQDLFNKYYKIEQTGTYIDQSYFRLAKPAVEALLEYGDEAIFGTDMEKNWVVCSDIHNRGVSAWGGGTYRQTMPHWYRFF